MSISPGLTIRDDDSEPASSDTPVVSVVSGEPGGGRSPLDLGLTVRALPRVPQDPPVHRVSRLPRPDLRSPDDSLRVLQVHRRRAVALDLASAALAGSGAVALRFGNEPTPAYLLLTLLVPGLWAGLLWLQRCYEDRYLATGPEEYRRVLDAGLRLFVVLAVISFVGKADLSRAFVLSVVPVTVMLTLVARRRLRAWVFALRRRGRGLQRVLVVGRADAAVSLIEKLDHEPHHGLVPVGVCVPPAGDAQVSHMQGVPVVGDPSQILRSVDELAVHTVAVVSHPDLSGHALRRLAWALEERGVELVVSPGIVEVAGPRLSIRPVAGLSLLHLERPAITGGRWILKTVGDRLAGSLLLVAALPVLAVVAAAIKLTSPGPVLFRQTRVGVDGTRFTMLKFRSMVADAEDRRVELLSRSDGNDVLFKMRADPRITGVGRVIRRLSVDELPQLVNVVRGDMSLVGPRPPLPEEVAGYSDDATRRLRVRPGMTGLWQVSGRSDLSWEESLRLDLRYVDNWSPALDLLIMWRTLRAVLAGSGAY